MTIAESSMFAPTMSKVGEVQGMPGRASLLSSRCCRQLQIPLRTSVTSRRGTLWCGASGAWLTSIGKSSRSSVTRPYNLTASQRFDAFACCQCMCIGCASICKLCLLLYFCTGIGQISVNLGKQLASRAAHSTVKFDSKVKYRSHSLAQHLMNWH